MGVFIQRYKLSEEQFRGNRFKDHPVDLKGNNDLLVLTQPEIIKGIHRSYLEAGADIIETNTFNGTSISQADYKTENLVYEINFEAAKIAREAINEFNKSLSSRFDCARLDSKAWLEARRVGEGKGRAVRFVAGSLGPTNKTLSLSPDVNDPGFRSVTFEEMAAAFKEQARGLIDGARIFFLKQ